MIWNFPPTPQLTDEELRRAQEKQELERPSLLRALGYAFADSEPSGRRTRTARAPAKRSCCSGRR